MSKDDNNQEAASGDKEQLPMAHVKDLEVERQKVSEMIKNLLLDLEKRENQNLAEIADLNHRVKQMNVVSLALDTEKKELQLVEKSDRRLALEKRINAAKLQIQKALNDAENSIVEKNKLSQENSVTKKNWEEDLEMMQKETDIEKIKKLQQQAIAKLESHKPLEVRPSILPDTVKVQEPQPAAVAEAMATSKPASVQPSVSAPQLPEPAHTSSREREKKALLDNIKFNNTIIEDEPNEPEAYHMNGQALVKLAKLETGEAKEQYQQQALEAYNKAIELSESSDPIYLTDRSKLYAEMGQASLAAQDIEKVEQLPKRNDAHGLYIENTKREVQQAIAKLESQPLEARPSILPDAVKVQEPQPAKIELQRALNMDVFEKFQKVVTTHNEGAKVQYDEVNETVLISGLKKDEQDRLMIRVKTDEDKKTIESFTSYFAVYKNRPFHTVKGKPTVSIELTGPYAYLQSNKERIEDIKSEKAKQQDKKKLAASAPEITPPPPSRPQQESPVAVESRPNLKPQAQPVPSTQKPEQAVSVTAQEVVKPEKLMQEQAPKPAAVAEAMASPEPSYVQPVPAAPQELALAAKSLNNALAHDISLSEFILTKQIFDEFKKTYPGKTSPLLTKLMNDGAKLNQDDFGVESPLAYIVQNDIIMEDKNSRRVNLTLSAKQIQELKQAGVSEAEIFKYLVEHDHSLRQGEFLSESPLEHVKLHNQQHPKQEINITNVNGKLLDISLLEKDKKTEVINYVVAQSAMLDTTGGDSNPFIRAMDDRVRFATSMGQLYHYVVNFSEKDHERLEEYFKSGDVKAIEDSDLENPKAPDIVEAPVISADKQVEQVEVKKSELMSEGAMDDKQEPQKELEPEKLIQEQAPKPAAVAEAMVSPEPAAVAPEKVATPAQEPVSPAPAPSSSRSEAPLQPAPTSVQQSHRQKPQPPAKPTAQDFIKMYNDAPNLQQKAAINQKYCEAFHPTITENSELEKFLKHPKALEYIASHRDQMPPEAFRDIDVTNNNIDLRKYDLVIIERCAELAKQLETKEVRDYSRLSPEQETAKLVASIIPIIGSAVSKLMEAYNEHQKTKLAKEFSGINFNQLKNELQTITPNAMAQTAGKNLQSQAASAGQGLKKHSTKMELVEDKKLHAQEEARHIAKEKIKKGIRKVFHR